MISKVFNPIYIMMHSGARGSREHTRQLGSIIDKSIIEPSKKTLENLLYELP